MTPQRIELVDPFEWVRTDPPFTGQITRPVPYHFTHFVLRDALFTWHPELSAALHEPGPTAIPFMHLWSKTAQMSGQVAMVRPGVTVTMDDYWSYVQPLARAMRVTPAHTARYNVWLLEMPQPKAPADCHFVALCKPRDEGDEYRLSDPSTRSRFFALEYSGQPGTSYLCTWSASGHHDNLGVETNGREEHFISRVYALLPR